MDNKNMLFTPNQKKSSYFRTVDVIFLLIVTCVVTLNMAYLLSLSNIEEKTSSNVENSAGLNKFINEYNRIVNNYYGELDEDELIDAALNGLIEALPDDYSSTIDESESNSYDTKLQGSFEGIGIEIINDAEDNIYIYRIIENSPAAASELKAGDKIIKIDDLDLVGKKTTEFVNYVKNSKSKQFKIVVIRDDQQITIDIRKNTVELKSVSSEIMERNGKNIGYIDISIFAANTYDQFKKELSDVESKNIDGLIIDVRGNGGGYLSAVTNMLSLFIDKSDIIYQTEQNGKVTKIYSQQSGTKVYNIVVLIDGGSASASEIFAAGLSEQCGAKLVGKKTYGKGTVQELITLNDGTQYKYTTKKWLTPKGNWIDGKGIEPDYDVDLDETYLENPTNENDLQLQKALSVLTD